MVSTIHKLDRDFVFKNLLAKFHKNRTTSLFAIMTTQIHTHTHETFFSLSLSKNIPLTHPVFIHFDPRRALFLLCKVFYNEYESTPFIFVIK